MSVIIEGISVPDSTSPTASWILYHKLLKSKYGADYASMLFAETWARCGNASLPDNADFDAYFTKQGINVKTGLDDLIVQGRDIVDDVTSFKTAIYWVIGIMAAALVIGVVGMLVRRPEALAGLMIQRRAAMAVGSAGTAVAAHKLSAPATVSAPKALNVETVDAEIVSDFEPNFRPRTQYKALTA